ncbi:hypothetical protein, variant 2 [Allomyces macrogynus ATCC 38327]|uniref:RING-type E3 ubiquitin transferase n=1 Tax=Allomyces macrogynus (strain ATCC 38327) TaxID=578462 RepID=A0A0L0RW83_ALLM3|nr:hypothetical protein, variant 2 [Allomyces macrogynus ATCC 38327]|eukprot:KNE54657.1 hypothetical protein, variant 2 [Allomyces macrogynus ATCC 38327]
MHLQMARAHRQKSRIAHDPLSAAPTWKALDTVQIPIPGKFRLLSPTCDPDLLLLTHQSDHDDHNLLLYSVGAGIPVVLPHVHTKLVRAIAVPPTGSTSLAATASMDATACLVQLRSQTIVARFALGAPGWSATFHSSDPNYLFFGTANSTMRMFDVRWPAAPLRDLADPLGPRGGQFLHSVVHVGSSLLAASMRSVVEWRHLDGPAAAPVCAKVVVPPDVPATAQCFAVERCYGRAGSFALAFRGVNVPAKYVVANVPAVGGEARNTAATTDPAASSVVFPSPVMASNSPATLMTRLGMWAHGDQGAYLAAPNEAHKIIDLFEVDGATSKWDSCLDPKCAAPLLDTKPILLPDRVVLAGVNEQGQLHLFESGAE